MDMNFQTFESVSNKLLKGAKIVICYKEILLEMYRESVNLI